MTFAVRRAVVEDAEQACAVLRRSIIECCTRDHHGDESVLAAWLQNKTPENVRTWFAASRAYAVVAEMDERLVGVAMLGGNGTVALCYLLPESQHMGVGRAMLFALEAEAARRGQEEVRLSSTQTAHAFYLRNGYQDTGVVESDFGLVSPEMRKALPDPERGRKL